MAGLPLQAHPDHTCQLTDIQCILQYIALAQDVSVLTLGLQSLQALCQCTGASSQGYVFFFKKEAVVGIKMKTNHEMTLKKYIKDNKTQNKSYTPD